MDPYQQLINKLEEFIKKFYKNLIIKGLIIEICLFLFFLLIFALIESFFYLGTFTRSLMFYLFILLNLFVLVNFLLIPIFRLFGLSGRMNYEQAARIVGDHFLEIKDKLINTLQLFKEGKESYALPLIQASLDQRIRTMSPFRFSAAVDLSETKKFGKYYLLPVIMFFLVFWFVKRDWITEGTLRIMDHNTYYAKPAPFSFKVLNPSLHVLQSGSINLQVSVKGSVNPKDVYIENNGNLFKMETLPDQQFSYEMKNLQQNTSVRFYADGFYSSYSEILVLPKPSLQGFKIMLHYPAYLGKKDEVMTNSGDLTIPAGTQIEWTFNLIQADEARFFINEKLLEKLKFDKTASIAYTSKQSFSYSLVLGNSQVPSGDSVSYNVTVIPDQYPSVVAQEFPDSVKNSFIVFQGQAADDYGFSSLRFVVEDPLYKKILFQEKIAVPHNQNSFAFSYYKDFSTLDLKAGSDINYYFEIFDNDGVSRYKSAKSQVFVFRKLSQQEAENEIKDLKAKLEKDMESGIRKAKELQKQMADLSRKMMEKKNTSWEDQQKAQDLIRQQSDLQQKLEEIKKNVEKVREKENDNLSYSETIKEKENQLDQLMNDLMSEDMKKMMDELQKLMDKVDKDKVQQELEKIRTDNKELEKRLDRSLELMKRLDVDKQFEKAIEKLKDLSKNENDLADKLEKNEGKKEDLLKKAEENQSKLDEIKKDLGELEKKDKQLESPLGFEEPKADEQELQKDMDQRDSDLKSDKKDKAGKSSKKNASKAEKMANDLQSKKDQLSAQQDEEDYNNLRQLLKNLIKLSFDQEKLMNDLKSTDINNPKYLEISQQQKRIKEGTKMVEDSLLALSKRVVQIKNLVNREISQANFNMDKALGSLEQRDVSQAMGRQQQVMTSMNNLALLIDESLQQMQQEMSQKSGKSSCSKPGGKKKGEGFSGLKQKQEKLNQMMDDMKKNPGGKDGTGPLNSKEVAKLAAQQQAIRNELRKLMDKEGGQKDIGKGEMNKLSEQMEQTEKDLVNKRLNPETMKRQKEILTRLLEAEKAEREREMDMQRESKEGKNAANRNPSEFERYKRFKMKEAEWIRTLPPMLNSYYKQKSVEYFQKIGN